MTWSIFVLFVRSFAVSAFVGVVYLLALELTQYLIGYQGAFAHSMAVLVLYLIGIYFNYTLQKKVVFASGEQAVKRFFAYNFFSAGLVSLLSSFFYGLAIAQTVFGHWIEAASTAMALLLVSPISFIVFRTLFRPSRR